jgi:hypothetical protein
MSLQRLGKSTTSIGELEWSGSGFVDPSADAMWNRLAATLKSLACAEIAAGNLPRDILSSDERSLVVLTFSGPPRTSKPSPDLIVVHTCFALYNFCYDGTVCTYEDLLSGCFLAFDDDNPERYN